MGKVSRRLSLDRLVVATLAAAWACGPGSSAPAGSAQGRQNSRTSAIPLLSNVALPPVSRPGQNGEDDGSHTVTIGPGLARASRAARAEFVAIGAPPETHPLICDLTPFAGHLYASFAFEPVNIDGAQIHRFGPAAQPPGRQRWTLAFDWDRGGAPKKTHEVGGQGITRVRVIAGRLFAVDSDAPLYGGFGLTDAPFEDYLFTSDQSGTFAPLGPDFAPPAGTRVLPLAFHVFDIIAYRGAIVASGGTVRQNRTGTRYPGGLFVGKPDSEILLPAFRPGEGRPVGVVRTTYMHRFAGRLYVGFQNNERRCRWDLAVLTGDPRDPATPEPVLARVTEDGGWLTRRFASAPGALYWIASGYRRDRRGSALFVSTDGQGFTKVALPEGAGAPQDIAIVEGTRFLLTTGGLYRSGPDHRFTLIAHAPPGDPFGRWDTFCSAPLAIFDDALYAGSTRDGTLYRIATP